jgi:hypothetical protein
MEMETRGDTMLLSSKKMVEKEGRRREGMEAREERCSIRRSKRVELLRHRKSMLALVVH